MPPNMADWLAADHLVWFVLDVVEQLDTTALHSGRRTGGVGRAGYDPDMLLALMIYAYATGQRSSRRIEQLCVDHVAYRVVCAQDPRITRRSPGSERPMTKRSLICSPRFCGCVLRPGWCRSG